MARTMERTQVEKPWLASYPPGVPAEIDASRYASIHEIFAESCARFGDAPAFSCMGRTLSFKQVEGLSRDFGAWLQSVAKLPRGTRVAIMMPNLLQYPVALFGALRAGYVVVNCNPLYTPRELEHQLKDSGAEAIVILENFAHTLQAVLGQTQVKTIVTTQIGDMRAFPLSAITNYVVKHRKKMVPPWSLPGAVAFPAVLGAGRSRTLDEPKLTHQDIAFLQYTGGTTGVSKAAMLTHGNIVANLLQTAAWWGPGLREGGEVIITALPLYHIFALTGNCLTFMKIGGHNVLITNPRDMPGFVKILGHTRFTCITGVNTLFNALLNTPGFAQLDFSALKMSLGGGMAVQRAVAERWKQVTGKPLVEGYGLTETSPGACINPVGPGADYSGFAGLPISSTTVTIRDDEGEPLPLGQAGEICIAGPQVMKGYWNRPDETAQVMTRDGSFRTGDIGIMTADGYVKIVDRKKDMILVSGFNVYPNELEGVVAMMPGVLEVAVIGVSDEHSGEVPKVFIVKKDPALTEQMVLDHCKAQLTGYKRPKYVEFRAELPKTNVGKILRRALRDEKKAA